MATKTKATEGNMASAISVRVRHDTKDGLDDFSQRQGRTTGGVLRRLSEWFVEQSPETQDQVMRLTEWEA